MSATNEYRETAERAATTLYCGSQSVRPAVSRLKRVSRDAESSERSASFLLALSAREEQRLPGDPARIVRREENRGSGDVFGLGNSA
jgi:hypothetical protein